MLLGYPPWAMGTFLGLGAVFAAVQAFDLAQGHPLTLIILNIWNGDSSSCIASLILVNQFCKATSVLEMVHRLALLTLCP
jgi:hypothetical protein